MTSAIILLLAVIVSGLIVAVFIEALIRLEELSDDRPRTSGVIDNAALRARTEPGN